MPYITEEARTELEDPNRRPMTPGELNYIITCVVTEYLGPRGEHSYTRINEVIGVLECAKLELYRRIAAPFEDIKIKENGDVYP